MEPELFYQLALTLVPHLGPAQAKMLLKHFDVQDIFRAKKTELAAIDGIGPLLAERIGQFTGYARVEQEMAFLETTDIRPLFLTDPDYPQRLLHCYDPPTLLFYRGRANLNAIRILAVVGSRTPTSYGQEVIERLVAALAGTNILLVSGLATGTQCICHRAAIVQRLPTVGVLAYGLDRTYPPVRHPLPDKMTPQGGLLTEFRHRTKPSPSLSGQRDRIVAGLSDAVVVIESDWKEPGMITAELAGGYFREVFAAMGKPHQKANAGCYYLVRTHQAGIFSNAKQLFADMNWV